MNAEGSDHGTVHIIHSQCPCSERNVSFPVDIVHFANAPEFLRNCWLMCGAHDNRKCHILTCEAKNSCIIEYSPLSCEMQPVQYAWARLLFKRCFPKPLIPDSLKPRARRRQIVPRVWRSYEVVVTDGQMQSSLFCYWDM